MQNKYVEYKNDYIILNFQTGGNNYKWLRDLWGKTKKIKYNGRDQVVKKPNQKELFIDGKKIKISFVPEIFHNNYSETIPIKYTKTNCSKMNDFFKTKVWEDFMKYCFDSIVPFNFPPHSPEIYRLDQINTKLEKLNGIIVIVIESVIKKYDYVESYKRFSESGPLSCTNKKCTEKIPRNMIFFDFYEYVVEAFFKSTEEGETHVQGIGQLNMGVHTRMKLEFIEQ